MKIALPLIALLGLAAVGCRNHDYVSPDDPHSASIKVPSIENTYEMVGVGKPPLSFIVSTGGWLKVVDATDNTLIHSAQVPPVGGGLTIKIDPDLKAITYTTADNAQKPQIVQPINPDHRFELYYQR